MSVALAQNLDSAEVAFQEISTRWLNPNKRSTQAKEKNNLNLLKDLDEKFEALPLGKQPIALATPTVTVTVTVTVTATANPSCMF